MSGNSNSAEQQIALLRAELSRVKMKLVDAQDVLALERSTFNHTLQKQNDEILKRGEEFKTQLTFKTQELERQKQDNRKLERRLQSFNSTANTGNDKQASSLSLSSFSAVSSQFANKKRKHASNTVWPKPGNAASRKKGKASIVEQKPQINTCTNATSESAANIKLLPSPPPPPPQQQQQQTANNTIFVRTNHMWAQQREASRALTGHLSGAVKILLGAAGYVEANAVSNVAGTVGRRNVLWTKGGRVSSRGNSRNRSRNSTKITANMITSSSSSSSSSSRNTMNTISRNNSRMIKLARDLRDAADGLYKCLMDLLAGQERESEATGAPLFAMTAAALRFLCIKGTNGTVNLPQSIEEAAISVVRLLIATTYKRGGSDVVKSGGVRVEDVSDQLCLSMHVAVTKVRRGRNASIVERSLGLLNVIMSIEMGSIGSEKATWSRENLKLFTEIKRLVSGRTTGECWYNRLNVVGTEVVNLVCQLGSYGNIFLKIEGVRALVVAVSKSIFRERGVSFLWRQINIIRMMVRLVSIVGDRDFWNLLKIHGGNLSKRTDNEEVKKTILGAGKPLHKVIRQHQVELYPLLGDMVGLLKRKMQERSGLVRREDCVWLGKKMEREDRENVLGLEELVILEGLKMLEKVEVLGNRFVHQHGGKMVTRPILGGRLGEETAGLYKMAKDMGMVGHLKRR
jgi:hypothetical protein